MKSAKSPLSGPLTAGELEIMKVIWRVGPATVRQVYEAMLEERKIAYTTVMTMMNILETKGFLKKRSGDKAFVYTPSKPEKQVIRAMVREFVDRVFNGAAEPLLLHLVEDDKLTRAELDEIRRGIKESKR
ncbi:MAG: BlaI/MecI/CopY family transcriptional regulator [Acidobacteriota bacterium]